MPFFDSDGVRIHYEDAGSGEVVVLVHGFASNARYNWGITGWIKFLSERYRVIALDCRGHGQSDKPHDPAAYTLDRMGGDVIRLLDHLGVRRALLMGYSMGARIAMWLMLRHPERFRAVVLGGVGAGGRMGEAERRRKIVEALLAPDASAIADEIARLFRQFAEANRNDLAALAACMGAERGEGASAAELASVRMPVMIVIGTRDTLVGDAEPLHKMIPGSELLKLEGRDHLNAPGDRLYKEAVGKFFAGAPA
jgi:pimeloyl-ACP methyl ester carboxylesterase